MLQIRIVALVNGMLDAFVVPAGAPHVAQEQKTRVKTPITFVRRQTFQPIGTQLENMSIG